MIRLTLTEANERYGLFQYFCSGFYRNRETSTKFIPSTVSSCKLKVVEYEEETEDVVDVIEDIATTAIDPVPSYGGLIL